jgi:hypothetical protein
LRRAYDLSARIMKRVGTFALIFLAAGAAAAAAAGTHLSAPSAARCGGATWRLKTFSDPQRRQVDVGMQSTNLHGILVRPGPGRELTRRSTPFQRQVWGVYAQITKYKLDSTGAVRLVLYDDNAYMNAVIPAPDCLSSKTRNRADIAAAWHLFTTKCGSPGPSWQAFGGVMLVRGIGFWTRKQPLRGTAPNGAELNPVTGFQVLTGC